MPTGLEDLDLRVYIDYPQERQNRKGPFVFATDGTQVDAGTKNNCLIDPVTLSVFGLPLPMTNDWKTNFSGNYARYQKSDFTFTSAGGSNDWLDIDYYGNGDTYIISASSVAARQSAAIQLTSGVERNEPLFFSFSKLQKKNSDSQNLIKLFWSDTTNSDKDVQLHFNSDGSCTVFRGYTPLTGNIIANTISSTITGVGTKFSSELSGGQTLCDVYGRVIGTIASITNDLSLTLGANAAYDFVGSYNNKTPLKVQSYSRTESNYSQGRPISTIANPNDQFNDVYIIPMRGRDLLVLTSFGLNFCHSFSDLNVPDPPANIRNYVNEDPMTSSINGTSVPIILPKGAFSIVINQGKSAFQLAKLYFRSNWSINSQNINTSYAPPIINPTLTGRLSAGYGSTVGTGLSTLFTSDLSINDRIYAYESITSGSLLIGTVANINSNTEIYFNSPVIFPCDNNLFYNKTKLSGTLSFGIGSTVVTGTGTSFSTQLNQYDVLFDNNDNIIGTVSSISSNTLLYLENISGLAGTNQTPIWSNLNQYSVKIDNYQVEYFGQTFPVSTDVIEISSGIVSSTGSTIPFDNNNKSFNIKIESKSSATGATASSDYGYTFYSSDFIYQLENETLYDSETDITSALETFSLQRNENGELSLSMSARKKLLTDLGVVKPEILSNRSIKVDLVPRVKQLGGTITTGSGTTLVTGTGTSFLTDFSPGDSVYKVDGTLVGIAVSIPNNTNLYTLENYPGGIEYNIDYSNEPNYDPITIFEGYLDSPEIAYIQGENYDNYSLLSFNAIDKKQHLNTTYFNVAPNFDNTKIYNVIANSLILGGQASNDPNQQLLDVDPSLFTYKVPLNRNNSNGQYNFVLNLGDTVGGFIEKVRSDYAQNFTFLAKADWTPKLLSNDGWINGTSFYFKDLDYTVAGNIPLALYLNEDDAENYGGIPIYESSSRTIRALNKTYETPEANRVLITGLDKSNGSRIDFIKDDPLSQDPLVPPALRPNNWMGDIFPFVMINDKLNTVSDVSQAGNQFFAKLSPGREIIEFDCDFLTYFDSTSKFTQNNISPLSGNITTNTSTTLVTGVSTLFTTQLSVGDTLYDNLGNILGIIATINTDTSLDLIQNAIITMSGSYNNFTHYLNQYRYLDIGDVFYFTNPDGSTETYKIIDWSFDSNREYLNPEYSSINVRYAKYRAKKVVVPNNNPPVIAFSAGNIPFDFPLANSWIITSGYDLVFPIPIVGQPYKTFVYSLNNEPVGMTIDSSSGVIQWTPLVGDDNQVYDDIEVIVSDGTDSSSFTFSIRVYPTI